MLFNITFSANSAITNDRQGVTWLVQMRNEGDFTPVVHSCVVDDNGGGLAAAVQVISGNAIVRSAWGRRVACTAFTCSSLTRLTQVAHCLFREDKAPFGMVNVNSGAKVLVESCDIRDAQGALVWSEGFVSCHGVCVLDAPRTAEQLRRWNEVIRAVHAESFSWLVSVDWPENYYADPLAAAVRLESLFLAFPELQDPTYYDHVVDTLLDAVQKELFEDAGRKTHVVLSRSTSVMSSRRTFPNPRSTGRGIFARMQAGDKLLVHDAEFRAHYAAGLDPGAAVYVRCEAGADVTMQHTVFDDNLTWNRGGGLFVSQTNATFSKYVNGAFNTAARSSHAAYGVLTFCQPYVHE